ncbi:hypothetical protein [Actinoallomurus sp. CA-142502]|uniref:hypothetical protein n=1 Tax=Actinoallomurus sp. CA-142502 TaxID=3239885 RepID=UPI003D8F69A3
MVVTMVEQTLLDFLRDEGQEPSSLEPSRTWRAFRRFMNVSVAGVEEDAMLYEYITASFGGPRHFLLSLCRQFDLNDEGGQALVQLRCDIAYEPTPALEALGKYNQWWSDGDGARPIGEVLDAIERRPEWAVIAVHTPVESAVYQEHAC